VNTPMTSGDDAAASRRRRRVLFMAEAVTLAHVARPLVLAEHLPTDEFEPILAADPRYESLYASSTVRRVGLDSIPSEQFTEALAKGKPIYSQATLQKYVDDDLKLINELKPDVIVGDMRLSLAVSARLAGVPYITLTNAYWSAYANVRYPIPDSPFTRLLSVSTAQALFSMVRPIAFAVHALPMHRVMRSRGLPGVGLSLPRVYSESDLTLYVDLPDMTSMKQLPAHHRYLGPILWEPAIPLPAWWDQLPVDKPVVYVNLGSSGPAARVLSTVLKGLEQLPVKVIVATAGKTRIDNPPANVIVADFMPGLQACRRASVVINNGGSPSTQQAIAAGKPMLCLPSNMDQLLNAQGIARTGTGNIVRADQISALAIETHARELLTNRQYAARALNWQHRLESMDVHGTFHQILRELLT